MTKKTAVAFTVAFLILMPFNQVVASDGSLSESIATKNQLTTENKQDAIRPDLTMRDCMNILTGLNLIAGEGNVSKFKFSAGTRDNISHDLFYLSQVQLEGIAANRRIQAEVRGDTEGQLSQKQLALLDERINQYLDRPCRTDLLKIRKEDLELDKNDIPPSVLFLIWRLFQ
jgi:hypothetical protein